MRRRRRRRRHFCWSIKCHPIGRYICKYIKFKAHPVGAADWAHDILSTWLVVVEESGLRFFQEHHESIQFSYRERDDYRWAEVTFSLFEAHVGRLLEFKEAHAIIY